MINFVENGPFTLYESSVIAIDSVVTLENLDTTKPHCFIGVQFFSDSDGLIPAVPTIGTVFIQVKTLNTQVFEDPPANIIEASAITTVSWAANTVSVRATPSGVDVATYYKVVVTCNET